ncbi:hypothetical protein B0H13DRAFT_1896413 [Mycena leptocephala]|nr:hypothetical protein B0H13DRAFT_1896413 [Mycena leptocephala]
MAFTALRSLSFCFTSYLHLFTTPDASLSFPSRSMFVQTQGIFQNDLSISGGFRGLPTIVRYQLQQNLIWSHRPYRGRRPTWNRGHSRDVLLGCGELPRVGERLARVPVQRGVQFGGECYHFYGVHPGAGSGEHLYWSRKEWRRSERAKFEMEFCDEFALLWSFGAGTGRVIQNECNTTESDTTNYASKARRC